MACGYLPEEKRVKAPELPRTIGETGWRFDDDGKDKHLVCPGWAVRQPFAAEAWQAFAASKAGILQSLFPTPPRALLEAVLICQRAQSARDVETIKKNARE